MGFLQHKVVKEDIHIKKTMHSGFISLCLCFSGVFVFIWVFSEVVAGNPLHHFISLLLYRSCFQSVGWSNFRAIPMDKKHLYLRKTKVAAE